MITFLMMLWDGTLGAVKNGGTALCEEQAMLYALDSHLGFRMAMHKGQRVVKKSRQSYRNTLLLSYSSWYGFEMAPKKAPKKQTGADAVSKSHPLPSQPWDGY